MGVIHMETELARDAARTLANAVSEMHNQVMLLQSEVNRLNWQGPSHDDFLVEFRKLTDNLTLQLEDGLTLGQRLSREIDEWERVDFEGAQQFCLSPEMNIPSLPGANPADGSNAVQKLTDPDFISSMRETLGDLAEILFFVAPFVWHIPGPLFSVKWLFTGNPNDVGVAKVVDGLKEVGYLGRKENGDLVAYTISGKEVPVHYDAEANRYSVYPLSA